MRSLPRSVWLFLLAGVALRAVALFQPIVDNGILRQAQTAAFTQSLIRTPGLALSATIPWLGDLDARYVLEFPLYNYLVRILAALTSNLDASGKAVSILLWAASFLCLQFIWQRLLNARQTSWANLLFVVAPLGVFYGQAFMPEMLVQLLAFGFILLVLRYGESPTLSRWISCAAVGLLALLVKLPETSHLYLLLLLVLLQRHGWRRLFRPRYIAAALVSLAVLKGWSAYVDQVNISVLSFGSSADNLRVFIGTLASRLRLHGWTMILLYLGAFVVPGPVIALAGYGLLTALRRRTDQILIWWLVSLALFYVLWFGNTAAAQNYYNLPALAPLCALVGIGAEAILRTQQGARWRSAIAALIAAVVIGFSLPALVYLFKQDRTILEAARWTRGHTEPNSVILFCPNHRWDMVDYPFNAVPAYYSDRPTFIWSRNTPEVYRAAALQRASYAIVTLPQEPARGILGAVNRFRRTSERQPQPLDWLDAGGFEKIAANEQFVAYRKKAAQP